MLKMKFVLICWMKKKRVAKFLAIFFFLKTAQLHTQNYIHKFCGIKCARHIRPILIRGNHLWEHTYVNLVTYDLFFPRVKFLWFEYKNSLLLFGLTNLLCRRYSRDDPCRLATILLQPNQTEVSKDGSHNSQSTEPIVFFFLFFTKL